MSVKFILNIWKKLDVCVELDTVGWNISIDYRLSEDWEGFCLMFDNLGGHTISIDHKNKNFLPYKL